MTIGIIVSLALAVPVVLLPLMFVWSMNAGGICVIVKRVRVNRIPQSDLN